MWHLLLLKIYKELFYNLLASESLFEKYEDSIFSLIQEHYRLFEDFQERLQALPLSEVPQELDIHTRNCLVEYQKVFLQMLSEDKWENAYLSKDELEILQTLEEPHHEFNLWKELKATPEAVFPGGLPDWYEAGREEVEALRLILLVRGVSQTYSLYAREWKQHSESLLKILEEHNAERHASVPLPEVDYQAEDFQARFQHYVQMGHPFKLKGFPLELEPWKLENFMAEYGDEVQPVFEMSDIQTNFLLPIRELLQLENFYVANTDSLLVNRPELLERLQLKKLSPLLGKQEYLSAQIFISAKGKTGSPIHNGYISNLFFQLDGKKEWLLFDPYYSFLLYAFLMPMDGQSAIQSVGKDSFHNEYFPLFSYCPRYDVTLEPGDILYNPFYWYHTVENLTEQSIAIATRFSALPGFSHRETCPLHNKVYALNPDMFEISSFLVQSMKTGQSPGSFYEVISHGRMYSVEKPEALEAFSLPKDL